MSNDGRCLFLFALECQKSSYHGVYCETAIKTQSSEVRIDTVPFLLW